MLNIWTIAKREYKHFFTSPIAYAIAFAILLILGILFYSSIIQASLNQYTPDIQVIIGPLLSLLLFTTPAITMRSLAEEQKMGTLEILLTAPVRDWEVVVGKWLGGMLFMLTLFLVTWIYPLILNQLVQPGIDQGPLITNYLGLVLIASALIGIGVAISSMFSNQIAAFFVTIGLFLVLWMISYPSSLLGARGSELLKYLDMSEHFYSTFYRGIIDLKDIVYYLSLTIFSLFLGSVSVEARRWR